MSKKMKKLHVLSKKAKICDVKMLEKNHSNTTRNYAVIYYQTLEEVPWHLGLKKYNKEQKFEKLWKFV